LQIKIDSHSSTNAKHARASNSAQAMSQFYKTHNISPLAGLVSLVQLPVTFGLFFGVQKMFNFPLEQLKDSGVAFLPELTVADSKMVLPLVMFVLVNTQIKAGFLIFIFINGSFTTAFGQGLWYRRAT
jgi:YidC/Oxa1 family membrane protein insertase